MIRRAPVFDLGLPKDRAGQESGRRHGNNQTGETVIQVPEPMRDDELKHGWTGKTKDELLNSPEYLPGYVSQWPRAYLVPTRQNDDRSNSSQRSSPELENKPWEHEDPDLLGSFDADAPVSEEEASERSFYSEMDISEFVSNPFM
jgi:hypothetical protein